MAQQTVVLKKYPNRRLYDTENSVYVTLKDVEEMIRSGRRVEVVDAKTDQDVTAFILSQIIMERAKRSNSILPVSLLHMLIRSGEDILEEFFDTYLERAVQSYLNYKKSMDEQMRLYMELGMDLSGLADRLIKEKGGFPSFYEKNPDTAGEDGGNP